MPKKSEKPSKKSQTIWTKRSAWPQKGALPPLPTSQKPSLATSTPAQKASRQPHQYVTPSIPHTGSARKQLMGHNPGLLKPAHTPSPPSCFDSTNCVPRLNTRKMSEMKIKGFAAKKVCNDQIFRLRETQTLTPNAFRCGERAKYFLFSWNLNELLK